MHVWTIILWGLLSASAGARIFYVDTNNPQARDTNAGTLLSAPWKTIGKAATTMTAGDTVQVCQGTYNEDVTAANTGSAAGYVVYRNYGTDMVKITGACNITGSYVIVQGFELLGGGGRINVSGTHNVVQENYVHHTANGNGLSLGGSNNVARYNRVANCGAGWGDNTGVSGSDNRFEYNEVSDPELQGEDLMKFGGFNHVIQNNYFHDCYEHDRHDDVFQCGFTTTDNILIKDNLITKVGGQVAMLSTWTGPISNFTFQNNVIIMEPSHLWCFNASPPGFIFVNNTVISPGMAVLNVGTTGTVVKNNIFYDPNSDGSNSCTYPTSLAAAACDYNFIYPDPTGMWGCPPKQAHDIWGVDPRFVNAAAGDYHLAADSPCIDAGTTDSAAVFDKDGQARYDDPNTTDKGGGSYTYYDIGAYEFGAVTGLAGGSSPLPARGQGDSRDLYGAGPLWQYVKNDPGLTVYDLTGKAVPYGSLVRPGIYLVRGAGPFTIVHKAYLIRGRSDF